MKEKSLRFHFTLYTKNVRMKWGTVFLSIRMELGMEVFSRKKKSLIVYFVSVSKYIRIFVPQLVELFGKN